MTSSKYFASSLSKFKHPAPIPDTNDVIYISHSQLHDTDVSRIYANHVQSVTFPGHVQFEDTLSETLYNKGKLYKVIFIEDDHFIIEGHISCKYNQHFVWKNAIYIEAKVEAKVEPKVEPKVDYKIES
jgi:hypothetical protein